MPSVMLENEYRRWTEVGRADQPLQIQAQLKGYETKDVSFGVFHAPKERVIQPVFSYSAIIKTTPGYYTFPDRITIKLAPLVGKLNEDSIPIKQGVIYQPEYKPSPPPVLTAKDAAVQSSETVLPMIIKGENLVLPRITAEAGDGSKVKSTLKAGNSAKGEVYNWPGLRNVKRTFTQNVPEDGRKWMVVTGATAIIPMTGGTLGMTPVTVGGEFLVDDKLKMSGDGDWDGNKEGAVHTISGNLTMFDYEFNSDETTPLKFKITKDGYVYLEGKGTVTDLKTGQKHTMK